MSSIHQEISFNAAPAKIYEALTQSSPFAALTGAPADIGAKVGDAFSLFGGMISGRHLEMTPGKCLVQAWRAGNWAEGVYSVVRFELAAQGTGTRLSFDHTGFPAEMKAELEGGWQKMYWEKMSAWLAN